MDIDDTPKLKGNEDIDYAWIEQELGKLPEDCFFFLLMQAVNTQLQATTTEESSTHAVLPWLLSHLLTDVMRQVRASSGSDTKLYFAALAREAIFLLFQCSSHVTSAW